MVEMHPTFPDLLAPLSPNAPVSTLPVAEWWAAVDALTSKASPTDVVDIARAAFARPTVAFDARWRDLLREHDAASPLQGSKRQIAILAAAALLQLSRSPDSQAVAVYARRCAIHAGWTPALPDLGITEAELTKLATDDRLMSPWPPFKTKPAINVEAALANLVDGQAVTGEIMRASIEAIASSVAEAIQRTARTLASAGQGREDSLSEQTEVIAWLLAGQSRTVGREWEAMSPPVAAVLAAVDLWRLTPFQFGRPDSVALINQAVQAADSTKNSSVKTGDMRDALQAAGFHAALPHTDLLGTCVAVANGDEIDAEATEIGVRIHDELLLNHVLAPVE